MTKLKKIFGGINLTWPKVIIMAVVAAIYTAAVAIIPALQETSLHTIAVSFEVWILIGIFIIMNSKSNLDAALKCFVFFLISQPLIYLLQVPFSRMGFGLFGYYTQWFIWTIVCFPMGFLGYFIKKDKWWGYIILLPMIALTALSYYQYLTCFSFCYPFYIAISAFCAVMMLLYPNLLFSNKIIKMVGTIVSVLIIAAISIYVALNPYTYSTEILNIDKIEGKEISKVYMVSLADEKYGAVSIDYFESVEAYMIHADFKKSGTTELIVKTPDNKTKTYNLTIGMYSYKCDEK